MPTSIRVQASLPSKASALSSRALSSTSAAVVPSSPFKRRGPGAAGKAKLNVRSNPRHPLSVRSEIRRQHRDLEETEPIVRSILPMPPTLSPFSADPSPPAWSPPDTSSPALSLPRAPSRLRLPTMARNPCSCTTRASPSPPIHGSGRPPCGSPQPNSPSISAATSSKRDGSSKTPLRLTSSFRAFNPSSSMSSPSSAPTSNSPSGLLTDSSYVLFSFPCSPMPVSAGPCRSV